MSIQIKREITVSTETPVNGIYVRAKIDPDITHDGHTDAVELDLDIPAGGYAIQDLKTLRAFLSKTIKLWEQN